MGNCCCKKNDRSFKSSKSSNKREGKSAAETSDDHLNTIQPMLKIQEQSESDDEIHENNANEQHENNANELCDDSTSEPCPIAMKIIDILCIYHSFIDRYNNKDENGNNICDEICTKMNDYDLLNLRDDYHHIITYHDSNDVFMEILFNRIMQVNEKNNIDNLSDINTKLDNDQNENYYFGHVTENEISMIQCLNQIHYDCTNKYMMDSEPNVSDINMDSNNDSTNENMYGTSKSKSMRHNHNMNQSCVINYLFKPNDANQMIQFKPNDTNLNTIRSDSDQTTSETDNISSDNITNPRIDVPYSPNKQHRKIGKLKWTKPCKIAEELEPIKVKQQKILNDDSWMNHEHKQKSKHRMSESIQMLGNTKLVSNNKWQKSLDSLQESGSGSFDLTSFDIADLQRDTDSFDENDNDKIYNNSHLRLDNQYEINRV